MIHDILGLITKPISFVPDYLRPWVFLATAIFLTWGLLARGWLASGVRWIITFALGVLIALSAAVLYVEYRLTYRARSRSESPSDGIYSVGDYWVSVLESASTAAKALRAKTWRHRPWPVKTIAITALLGLPLWLIGALVPAVASTQSMLGKGYAYYGVLETETGVKTSRCVSIVRQPPPTILATGNAIHISVGTLHPSTVVEIFLRNSSGVAAEKPSFAITTNPRGDASRRVDPKVMKRFKRGVVVEIRYEGFRELIRIS